MGYYPSYIDAIETLGGDFDSVESLLEANEAFGLKPVTAMALTVEIKAPAANADFAEQTAALGGITIALKGASFNAASSLIEFTVSPMEPLSEEELAALTATYYSVLDENGRDISREYYMNANWKAELNDGAQSVRYELSGQGMEDPPTRLTLVPRLPGALDFASYRDATSPEQLYDMSRAVTFDLP